MSKYPEIRVGGFSGAGLEKGPPYNLEIPFREGWIGLGTMGTTSISGPGADEEKADYKAEVERLTALLFAAPSLRGALERIVQLADKTIVGNDAYWLPKRKLAKLVVDTAKAALAEVEAREKEATGGNTEE